MKKHSISFKLWDKEGANRLIGTVQKCTVCEKPKKVYSVLTMHGKKEIHFPLCSMVCVETLQEWYVDVLRELI